MIEDSKEIDLNPEINLNNKEIDFNNLETNNQVVNNDQPYESDKNDDDEKLKLAELIEDLPIDLDNLNSDIEDIDIEIDELP